MKDCIKKTLGFMLAALMSVQATASAEPLVYRGNQNADLTAPNTGAGSTGLVPVAYSTNYETEYSPYASFMSSPYTPQFSQGGIEQNYAVQAPNQAGFQQNFDPYAANEVSPYSKYSPYLEVVGEGSNYTLGIDDVITIIVRNQPDFSGRFVLDPEGNIQYNFVGDIKAEGLTKSELRVKIIERLQEFVRYPEVAVMISEYRSKSIHVFGFVNRPGKYAMKGNKITVKEAIVAAGLPRADAKLSKVYVIRPSEFRENGVAAKKEVNLKKLIQKGDSAEDFYLEPGDTIYVNQRNFDKFVNGFSRLVGPLFQAAAVYELGFGNKQGGFISGGD